MLKIVLYMGPFGVKILSIKSKLSNERVRVLKMGKFGKSLKVIFLRRARVKWLKIAGERRDFFQFLLNLYFLKYFVLESPINLKAIKVSSP